MAVANVEVGTEAICRGKWFTSNKLNSRGDEREDTYILCQFFATKLMLLSLKWEG